MVPGRGVSNSRTNLDCIPSLIEAQENSRAVYQDILDFSVRVLVTYVIEFLKSQLDLTSSQYVGRIGCRRAVAAETKGELRLEL